MKTITDLVQIPAGSGSARSTTAKTAFSALAALSFRPTIRALPRFNSLHLMTSLDDVSNLKTEVVKSTLDLINDGQFAVWSEAALLASKDERSALSDSSQSSDISMSKCVNPLQQEQATHLPTDATPICRFFKHGELIRKPTLSKLKLRKRKSPPVHKKEIFGSPFSSDYFVKPLGTGPNLVRSASKSPYTR